MTQDAMILQHLQRGLPITPLENGQKIIDVVIKNGRTHFMVQCFCGNVRCTQKWNAKRSHSCGCMTKQILRDARKTHGHAKVFGIPTRTYSSWKSMHDRCLPSHKSRSSYFDRGIVVCERWTDFALFLADMGERPVGKQLDRRDNDLGYFQANCHWVTPKENCTNRRSTRLLLIDGQQKSMSEWSRIWRIPVGTIWHRLEAGWGVDDAVKRTRRTKKPTLCAASCVSASPVTPSSAT